LLRLNIFNNGAFICKKIWLNIIRDGLLVNIVEHLKGSNLANNLSRRNFCVRLIVYAVIAIILIIGYEMSR
jgi:hypothetical protein